MNQCPSCLSPIGNDAAQAAADLLDKINEACSQASYIRTAAGLVWLCIGISLLPFVGFVGLIATLFTLVLLPIMLVRWQTKFRRIQTGDPDFKRAKKNRNVALVLWAIPFPFAMLLLVVTILSFAGYLR